MELLPQIQEPWANLSGKSDRISVALMAYFCSLFLLLLFAFAVHNIVVYLIQQRRWKILTLILFYIIALIDIPLRIYTAIWVVPVTRNVGFLASFLP